VSSKGGARSEEAVTFATEPAKFILWTSNRSHLQDIVQSAAMGTFTVETNQLITRLATDCAAVRRLPAPWQRTMLWLMISLLCVAAVTGATSRSVM
jgi:hypothetical protein